MFSKKLAIFVVLAMIAPMLLAACGPTPEPEVIIQTVEVEVTKIVEKEGEKVTVIETVVEEVVVEVTVAAEEVAPVDVGAPRPDTYTFIEFGDPDTLDPNLNYETAGGELIMNVAEGLIFYDFTDGTSFIPQLATEVPTLENGGIGLAPFHDFEDQIPDELKKEIDAILEGIKAGELSTGWE